MNVCTLHGLIDSVRKKMKEKKTKFDNVRELNLAI